MNNSDPQLKKVTAEQILIQTWDAQNMDLQMCITLNPQVRLIQEAMEEYAKAYHAEQSSKNRSLKYVPFSSFLPKPLELKTGKHWDENDIQSAREQFEEQFFEVISSLKQENSEKDKEIERLSVLLGYLNRQ